MARKKIGGTIIARSQLGEHQIARHIRWSNANEHERENERGLFCVLKLKCDWKHGSVSALFER